MCFVDCRVVDQFVVYVLMAAMLVAMMVMMMGLWLSVKRSCCFSCISVLHFNSSRLIVLSFG